MLFGTPRHPDFQPVEPRRQPRDASRLLRDVGLLDDLYAAGVKVAALMVEMFADVSPDSDLFEQYSFISAEDLPEFRAMLGKVNEGQARVDTAGATRRACWRSRFASSSRDIGWASSTRQCRRASSRRARRSAAATADRDDVFEFFEPDRFSSACRSRTTFCSGASRSTRRMRRRAITATGARGRDRGGHEGRAGAARPRASTSATAARGCRTRSGSASRSRAA